MRLKADDRLLARRRSRSAVRIEFRNYFVLSRFKLYVKRKAPLPLFFQLDSNFPLNTIRFWQIGNIAKPLALLFDAFKQGSNLIPKNKQRDKTHREKDKTCYCIWIKERQHKS